MQVILQESGGIYAEFFGLIPEEILGHSPAVIFNWNP